MQKIITSFSGEYAFLSNFYPCILRHDGYTFTTLEHAFQAAKAVDTYTKQLIAEAETPGKAKRIGRRCQMRQDWELIKNQVMLDLLRQKFAHGTILAEKLDKTGDAILVEGNSWHDNYWGSCTCNKCKNDGMNTLGQLLIKVRDENRGTTTTEENAEKLP